MDDKNRRPATSYYRARVTKGEEIRYISHLDYASLMQRAICRAKLPVVYSEGFNPHMKLSFASALAVGVTSEAEYMDIELSNPITPLTIAARLNHWLPQGVRVISVSALPTRPKALMASVDEATYEILVPLVTSGRDPQSAIQAFHESGICIYTRKTPKTTRDIDLCRYILGHIRATEMPNQRLKLFFSVRITPQGSIKPQEVLSVLCRRFALPVSEKAALIHRKALLANGHPLVSAELSKTVA